MFCRPLSLRLVGVWTPRYLISIGSCPLTCLYTMRVTFKCIEIRDRYVFELNQTCMCLLVLWINVLTCGKWQIVDRSSKVWTAEHYSLGHPSSTFRLKATMLCALLRWFTLFKMSMFLGMWLFSLCEVVFWVILFGMKLMALVHASCYLGLREVNI